MSPTPALGGGTFGGGGCGARVAIAIEVEVAELFPAPSNAVTVYEYSVEEARPVSA